MATDIGRIFEREVQKVFKRLKETHTVGLHRLADTGAAGGQIMQEQPSDYIVGFPEGTPVNSRLAFMEAKASEKLQNLTKSLIKPSQRGAIHFYGEVLGITYIILFWSVQSRRVDVWDGKAALAEGSIRRQSPIGSISNASTQISLDVDHVAAGLAEILSIPPRAKTMATYKERYQ